MSKHGFAGVFRGGWCALGVAACAWVMACAAGCVNWSKDVGRYRAMLDGAGAATRPALGPGEALSLAGALALANADNESIASRGEEYVQALAEKMRLAGTFLPTLTLAPSYSASRTHVSGVGSSTSDQGSASINASASGSLSQLSNVRSAEQTVEQRAQLMLDARETVLLQVAESYYSVLRAERQAEVYENGMKLRAERVRDQEARLRLGNVKPLDLAQSQADLAGIRASLTQSRTDAMNARSALATLIGAAEVSGPLVDRFDPPAEIPVMEAWQQAATMQRQDLLAADRSAEAARLSLQAAIRQYFPSLAVNFNDLLLSDPSSPQRWSGTVSANLPIFSALAIEADIRRAWSVYRQAGLARSQTRRQALDDVNQGYQSLVGSRRKIADLRVQVEAARRALDLAERAYQLGSVSNLDRLTQQNNLLTAELNLLTEQFNEKTNYLALLRAAGELATLLRGS